MTWVAAAVVGGAVIGGVASNAAAKKGAKAQTSASGSAIDFERESRDLALGMQKPYRDASYAATAALMDLTGLPRGGSGPMSYEDWSTANPAPVPAAAPSGKKHHGLLHNLVHPSTKNFLRGQIDPLGGIAGAVKDSQGGPSDPYSYDPRAAYQKYVDDFKSDPSNLGSYAHYDFKTDPGYEFRLGEGNKTLEHSLVARGGALSGAAAKSSLRYAQDYASNEYRNVYDRIASIAGFGQTATNASSNIIQNTGANVGNAILNAGDARASSYIAQGNAWSNAINQASQAGGFYYGNRTGFGA